MYRKILVPLDGSVWAEKVLPFIVSLAKNTQAEIVLLRVPLYAYADERATAHAIKQVGGPVPLKVDRDEAVRECTRYLNKLRNNLIRLGVRVSVIIDEGAPVPRIVANAERADVDLVVMAARKPRGWRRFFSSGIFAQVVKRSTKPVMVIHAEA